MTESATWDAARAAQTAAINPDVLASAALACRDAERVRFSYGAASGERTHRHVEPHRLVALDRRWYLVAYDLTSHDWRTFRLDRITGAAADGRPVRFRTLPAADAAEFVRRNITAVPGTWQVEAVIEAPASVIRERIGRWAKIKEDGPGRCLVTMSPGSNNLDWPVIALGVAGADFKILSPPELAERIDDWGTRFTLAVQPPARESRPSAGSTPP